MIGKEIGHYRIVEKLGEGGMGVVYKAIETQLERPVAIKALSPQLSSNRELMERFRAEARAHAQMNHPNVATLYTFLVQDDTAYMVMEYVDGEGFDKIGKRRGPIPAAEAIPLFRQALAGIAYAHSLGIIHRDIKPSNIMLNRAGIVKVMDFGLAKIIGDPSLTATGLRLGTVYYMSPEQILNKPADVRSDIYALGATLYEILTGNVLFAGDSDFHILNAHVNTSPPLLSAVCANVPASIERAVLKALAKNPDERFQSVGEFAAALEQPYDPAAPYAVTADLSRPPISRAARTEVVTTLTAHPPLPEVATGKRGRGGLAAAVAAVLLIPLAAGWLFLRPRSGGTVSSTATPAFTKNVKPEEGGQTAQTADLPAAPAAAPPLTVPSGTIISVRTVDPVDAKGQPVGQEYEAKLASPVIVGDRVAFHDKDGAHLRLQEAATVGKSRKPDAVLQLVSINAYPVTSTPYLIKGGLFRKKSVKPGTRIDFTLSSPVTLKDQP